MRKQFKILLILFFVSTFFLIASPSFAISSSSDCDEPNAKITSISPGTAVPFGESLIINGYGFGELKKVMIGSWPSGGYYINDRYIDISLIKDGIVHAAGMLEQDSGIISWTDTKIEVILPNDIESKFLSNIGQNDYINLTKDSLVLSIYHSNLVENGMHSGIQYYTAVGEGTHYICADPFLSGSFLYKPSCNSDTWTCSNWGTCSQEGQQSRNCNKTFDCRFADTPSPITAQSCTPAPICTSWNYSDWESCTYGSTQKRSIISSFPPGCDGGLPFLYRACPIACFSVDWSCSDWSACLSSGTQTRTCTKKTNCEGGASSPPTSQSCTYTPKCAENDWSCGNWSSCSFLGSQTRICSKTTNCQGGATSPTTSQSCVYTPACSADIWQCGNWGTCSPQGVQTRSCNRTYDCPSAETAAPATSQYCEAPNQPKLQSPTEDLGIVNQDSIIKSTVKLICPVSKTMASQGSGTVIDSKGTILTNKHVIDGTPGCLVGFIDNYGDEPYFGDRQIADIYKISSDADVAVLKLRNPNNKILTSINVSQSKSNNIKLGEILTTYGYPAKFGTNITYTSGDFSGVDGYYLKTTAVIEHGNSGGGAYLKNGSFIGIPTAVIKGSLNSMGYLLSVDKVNSWLNNSVAYNNNTNNNNYSRVSAIVEDIDLNSLDSLGLYITGDEANVKTGAENKNDKNLNNRLKGKILLQVEGHGEAWYVNPKTGSKHYMANGNEAYRIMRYLGVGITNKDLEKIKANKIFAKKNGGKIFLQVESRGEAYYIDFNGNTHYLKDGGAAYTVMRNLGLGIKNADLNKIPQGSL